jgi:hypothetical protein
MFAHSNIYFRLHLLLIIIHITCISLSLRQTSAPIYLTSVLGVLGTQGTSCIIIAWLLERDTFDLFLPEFDKPWVIHLSETCCCSTNPCTWRPNTVYKNRSIHRHQLASLRSLASVALVRTLQPLVKRRLKVSSSSPARAFGGEYVSRLWSRHPWPGVAAIPGMSADMLLCPWPTRLVIPTIDEMMSFGVIAI